MCDGPWTPDRPAGPAAGPRGADQLGGDGGRNPLAAGGHRSAVVRRRVVRDGGRDVVGEPVRRVGVDRRVARRGRRGGGGRRGFALSIGLRVHDVANIRSSPRYGTDGHRRRHAQRVATFARRLADDVSRCRCSALDGVESHGRVVVFASAVGFDELTAGRPVSFPGPHRPADAARTHRGDAVGDGRADAWARPPGWQRVAAHVRAAFADAARAVLPADQAAMLPALVLGDTSARAAGRRTPSSGPPGSTHLTAVSGANVTIVCGAVLLTAAVIGPRAAAVAAALALVAFVAVVQPSASVLRAAVMGAVTLFAIVSRTAPSGGACVVGQRDRADDRRARAGRRPGLRAVGGGHCGARRDCAGVVAAARRTRLAQACLRTPSWWRWPRSLVTAPIIAGMSGTFSVVSVVANLAVAVVIPPITVIGTAAATLSTLWPSARTAADPIHRTRGVVAAARGALDRGGARVPALRCRRGGPVSRAWQAPGSPSCWVAVALGARLRGRRSARPARLVGGPGCRRCRRGRDTIEHVSQLHLVLGEEDLFVERAIADVLRSARRQAGTDDIPIDRLRAGEVGTSELAELSSPSLFADERVVVLEAAAEAGKDAVALIASTAADLPRGHHARRRALGRRARQVLGRRPEEARRRGAPVRQDHQGRGARRTSCGTSSVTLKMKVSEDDGHRRVRRHRLRHPRTRVGLLAVGRRYRRPGRRRSGAPVSQRQGRGEGLRHRRHGRRRRRRRRGRGVALGDDER